MKLLKKLQRKAKMAQRVGAFARAREQGMSVDEARAYADEIYPPEEEDAAGQRQIEVGQERSMPVNHTLEYLDVISSCLTFYREINDFDDLEARLGRGKLRDVTLSPTYQDLEARDPTPQGFTRRNFHFHDSLLRTGTLEAVFKIPDHLSADSELAVISSKLAFSGLFRGSKAKKFFHNDLRPLLEHFFGNATAETPTCVEFTKSGIYGRMRLVPGYPVVSTHLIDERWK